ncbi:MAG: hypothetical protein HKN89_00230 [Eudoraea sp.]|nr:hypothetical protein [Eudoraea sp.]
MKTKYLPFFFLSLTFGLSWAQDLPERELSGRVIADEKNVADVHVMNTTRGKATITNESGQFQLSVGVGDTLLFSAIQFRRKSFIITKEIYDARVIAVPLEEFVNELDEVVLRPYDLSGDLDRDMQQIDTEGVVSATILGLPNPYHKPPTQAERRLFEATSGGGLVPLNPILNAITGRTKYLKKILQTQSIYARTERVREFYADSLFIADLKIPSAKIDDFMYYCEVDPGFSGVVDSRDRLQIWEFLKKKSGSYREANALD